MAAKRVYSPGEHVVTLPAGSVARGADSVGFAQGAAVDERGWDSDRVAPAGSPVADAVAQIGVAVRRA